MDVVDDYARKWVMHEPEKLELYTIWMKQRHSIMHSEALLDTTIYYGNKGFHLIQ